MKRDPIFKQFKRLASENYFHISWNMSRFLPTHYNADFDPVFNKYTLAHRLRTHVNTLFDLT